MAQMVKNLPAMQETRLHSWVRKIPGRSEWLPTPVFLPGKFHGQRSLAGYSLRGLKELDTTEQLTFSLHIFTMGIKLENTWPPLVETQNTYLFLVCCQVRLLENFFSINCLEILVNVHNQDTFWVHKEGCTCSLLKLGWFFLSFAETVLVYSSCLGINV